MRSKVFLVIAALLLSGCTVRTYRLTRDRIDQDVASGNRGYLQGQAPAVEQSADKKTTRTTQIVEVEFRPLIKFEKGTNKDMTQQPSVDVAETAVTEDITGNRGYITQNETIEEVAQPAMESYKVQRGDTLQKISSKFYGTTKKWNKIYEANRDVLKSPNTLRPGQVLNIPASDKQAHSLPKGLK